MKRFDAIVLGLGAMGSAALCHLARRGSRVLGLDRYDPPHTLGSTHGDTRITRLAIGEGAHYTPLAVRSHELWREIERETGAHLLTCTGGLIISSGGKTSFTHVEGFFENTLSAARQFGIAHELLDAKEIRRRYPPFKVSDDEVGYLERDAGFLRPEACVYTQLALARQYGAEIHTGETALGFDASSSAVSVATDKGTYAADRLVLCAGPWLPELIGPAHSSHFRIFRQVLLWFDIESAAQAFAPERFPVFIWQLNGKPQAIYGFPAIDGVSGGMKVATERYGAVTSPGSVDHEVSEQEIRETYGDYVGPYIQGLGARCVKSATCLYTVLQDFGFIIDTHPQAERVLVVSACSGHGFKHSPAIGEMIARWTFNGDSGLNPDAFGFRRFAASAL
ncbi:MAG TPA: N-methyl-L-tryptophan oxidase [Casimicrobiaceae bacterium]|nr:N-methyl-L-tryptophan oxidase [Casimicrobiaceae bacterium]